VDQQENCYLAGMSRLICDPVSMSTAAQASKSDGFGLVVRFTIRAGHEREFDELVAGTVAAIAEHEPGTLLYVTHAVDQQPSLRIFYELYRDRAAFDEHERQPHVRHFLTERKRLVERTEVDRLSPLAQAGVGRAAS
jgi:quinol monooxygenase YgiN